MKATNPQHLTIEIRILAGGLSTRMGRDKARIRLGRYTMLGHVRKAAQELNLPVRILRRDLVPRCGPLGGIYTGLMAGTAPAMLFLACDMPFVTPKLLKKLTSSLGRSQDAVFFRHEDLAGFPLLLRREACLPVVKRQIARKEFSLQKLASALGAKVISPPAGCSGQLENINTTAELESARDRLAR